MNRKRPGFQVVVCVLFAVAWGIIGMYLLLAIEITSLMRDRLSVGGALPSPDAIASPSAGVGGNGARVRLIAAGAALLVVVTVTVMLALDRHAPPAAPAASAPPAVTVPPS